MIYNRYRSDATPALTASFVKNQWSGSTKTVDNVTSLVTKNSPLKRIMYDTVVPEFKKRLGNGEIFNNELLSQVETFNAGGNYVFIQSYNPPSPATTSHADWRGFDGYVHTALYKNTWGTVQLDSSLSLQRAQIQALGAVNKTDFDAGTFMGEWSKTKQIHRDLCNALLKVVTEGPKAYVKRSRISRIPVYDAKGNPILNRKGNPTYRYVHEEGNVSGTGSLIRVKNTANLYLAGRYGVLPLIGDLENAWKFLGRKYNRRFTARGWDSIQGETTTLSRWNTSDGYFDNEIRTVRTLETRVGILFDTDPFSRALAGVGFTRPLSTAWELTRLSFLVDWIVDVGSWLDAMQPAGFTRNLCSWVSTKETLIVTTKSGSFVRTVPLPQYTYQSYSLSDWSAKSRVTTTRGPWDASIPRLPALGSGFNLIRSFDLASLVAQKIKGKL